MAAAIPLAAIPTARSRLRGVPGNRCCAGSERANRIDRMRYESGTWLGAMADQPAAQGLAQCRASPCRRLS